MVASRILSKRSRLSSKPILAAAVAAVCATSSICSASYTAGIPFSDDFPQVGSSTTIPYSSINNGSDSAWTFTASSTDDGNMAIQIMSNFGSGTGAVPAGESNDPDLATTNYLVMDELAAATVGTEPTITIETTSNAELGNYQPNTTYTLQFYTAVRSGDYTWASGANIVAELTDMDNSTTYASLTVTQANINGGSSVALNTWYLETLTFATPATISDGIAIEFIGNTNGTVNGAQLNLTDIDFTATSVPEPACLGLMGIASVGLLLRGSRRRSDRTAPLWLRPGGALDRSHG